MSVHQCHKLPVGVGGECAPVSQVACRSGGECAPVSQVACWSGGECKPVLQVQVQALWNGGGLIIDL